MYGSEGGSEDRTLQKLSEYLCSQSRREDRGAEDPQPEMGRLLIFEEQRGE